jgi:pilus assembly protein CpaE
MLQEKITVRLEIENRDLRNQMERIVTSQEAFSVPGPQNQDRADLLILELGEDIEKGFQLVQSLLSLGTVGEVFLTSRTSDPAVLVQSMRAGVKEFFIQPIKEEELRQALLRLKERGNNADGKHRVRRGKVVDIVGAKGGVGTTTIAVNLAASVARTQSLPSVAIVDMNLLFGEVPVFLDLQPAHHWGEVADNLDRLDSTFLMNILSSHSSGVYVLPSPTQLNGSNGARPETVHQLLGVMRGMFDFIVIDGGNQLDDTCLESFEVSDTVLFVSVLTLPCLANMNRLLKTFCGLGHAPEKAMVVVNRYLKNPDVSVREAEKSIHKKISRTIPNDYRMTMSAINRGKTLVEVAPRHPITRSMQALAAALVEKEKNEEKKTGLFGSLFNGRN